MTPLTNLGEVQRGAFCSMPLLRSACTITLWGLQNAFSFRVLKRFPRRPGISPPQFLILLSVICDLLQRFDQSSLFSPCLGVLRLSDRVRAPPRALLFPFFFTNSYGISTLKMDPSESFSPLVLVPPLLESSPRLRFFSSFESVPNQDPS